MKKGYTFVPVLFLFSLLFVCLLSSLLGIKFASDYGFMRIKKEACVLLPGFYWIGGYEGNDVSSHEGAVLIESCSNQEQTITVESSTGLVVWSICSPKTRPLPYSIVGWYGYSMTLEKDQCVGLPWSYGTIVVRP